MTEKEESLKQVAKFLKREKESRIIEDYDSGLMQMPFRKLTGTPEEIFHDCLRDLFAVTIRILNISDEKNKPVVLGEIEKFFNEIELPNITTDVNDYGKPDDAERIIELKNGTKEKFKITTGEFVHQHKSLREEHYLKLTLKTQWLTAKAFSLLNEEIVWHEQRDFVLNIPVVGTITIGEETDDASK